MSNLREGEFFLGGLSSAEKTQVLKWVVQDLSGASPGIDSIPNVCGGDACIVRMRTPVWLLEHARRLGSTEQDLPAAYPTLRAGHLVNAWRYTRSHPAEIGALILENESECCVLSMPISSSLQAVSMLQPLKPPILSKA